MRGPIAVLVEALLAAVALTVAASVLLLIVGANPLEVGGALATGAFGGTANFGETLVRMIPIAVIALGLIPSLRIGLFNIGAPGQMDLGALCAALPSLAFPATPAPILLAASLVAAMIGGALPSAICGLLRSRLSVNEILATLVLNMLARLFLEYLLAGPLHGLHANLPQSDPLPAAAWLPTLMAGSRANWGVVAAALLLAITAVLNGTPLGYRLRLYGASPNLGLQAGVKRLQVTVWTMAFAGACAGLAGWIQVAGVDHRLYATVADPVGYTGLFAALLGRLQPFGVVAASLVFAALLRGGEFLQIGAGISPEIISALVGLMLIIIAGRSIFRIGGSR
jgi:general nucleoside transport system permease protein